MIKLFLLGGRGADLNGINADLLLISAQSFVPHHTVDEREKRIVAADADIGAGMDLRASLANEDIARKHCLTVAALGPQSLGFAVLPLWEEPVPFL